jgi:hypothetical protein
MGLDTWTINEKVKRLKEEVDAEIKDLKKNFAILYEYIKKVEDKLPVEKAIKKESGRKKKVTSAQA